MGGFWTFESPLEPHFEAPTSEELATSWQMYHQTEAHQLDGDFVGLFEVPETAPRAVVSLDLCEVLRESGIALESIHNSFEDSTPQAHAQNHEYGDLYSAWQGDARTPTKNRAMLQQLMYLEYVAPVPHHEAIQAFLQRWHHNNIYVIANTSTLPGCETSTIKFLADTYPGSLRGILLPGNHDGLGTTTKPDILRQVKQRISHDTGFDITTSPTIAIDDALHHGKNFAEEENNVQVFMPAYKWNESLENAPSITRITQRLGTIDTFIAVDNYFVEHGILK